MKRGKTTLPNGERLNHWQIIGNNPIQELIIAISEAIQNDKAVSLIEDNGLNDFTR